MTSNEWRNRLELQAAAAKLLDDPHMKIILGIMQDESPINRPLPAIGSSADDKAMAYGVELGYRHFLVKLQLFRKPSKTAEVIESTFGVPPEDAQPTKSKK